MTIAVDFERKATKQTNKQTKLQLNKANSSDTEAPCFDLDLAIRNGIVSYQIYDKGGAFNFEMVNFPFLDGDVPCPSTPLLLMVCIFHRLFVLREGVPMLMTSRAETQFLLLSF